MKVVQNNSICCLFRIRGNILVLIYFANFIDVSIVLHYNVCCLTLPCVLCYIIMCVVLHCHECYVVLYAIGVVLKPCVFCHIAVNCVPIVFHFLARAEFCWHFIISNSLWNCNLPCNFLTYFLAIQVHQRIVEHTPEVQRNTVTPRLYEVS